MSNSGFWRLSLLENRLPGAIELSRLGRKTANHDAQWTCRCSTNMPFVKHITPNPRFTKQRWYLQGPRRQLLMLGTGITGITNPRRRSPLHHVHNAMGSVPIQNLSTGLRCFTGRIHQKIPRDCQ